MNAHSSYQKLTKPIAWLFFAGVTAMLLGYQTVLLNDITPTGSEKIMTWLTSRGILILAIGYGFIASRWYAELVDKPSPKAIVWMVLQIGLLLAVGVSMYLITGDSTFVGLALAALVLMALWRTRGRWVALAVVVLLLNLPVQVSRWYQANRNLPLPTSEQINTYEQNQRQFRQQRAQQTQYWTDQDYSALASYHATVWTQRLLSDIQTGRWSSLIGMVLLGMMFRRWREVLNGIRRNIIVSVSGVCALTTLLELTSGRTYATTLRLYFDSLRYPGYYVFDVPDALYLTVAEAACLSAAVLVGLGMWLLSGLASSAWGLEKRRLFRKWLFSSRLLSYTAR